LRRAAVPSARHRNTRQLYISKALREPGRTNGIKTESGDEIAPLASPNPAGSLANSARLSATPFRTDDWKLNEPVPE
jgi:hypothetical protein